MQLLPLPFSRSKSGYGLIITLTFLAILLIAFASMLLWSSSNSQITVRNNLFNESENAAESSTENILAFMMRDFNSSGLGDASTYAGYFPPTNGWPIYYQFSDTNGSTSVAATVTIGQFSTNAEALDSQFAGLYGFVMPCTIATTATPLGQGQDLSATVCQNIQFTLIPLFQFAIFYNMDLEINPGSSMGVNGHVHSNGTIWATGNSSSQPLIFSNYVDAASGVFLQSSTNDPHNSRSGHVTFAITNNNPIGNADVLNLPIGAATSNNNASNVLAILNPSPSSYSPGSNGAYNGDGTNYLENQADLIVSNRATGDGNLAIYYQNPNNTPYLLRVLPDVPIVTSTYVTNSSPYYIYKATNIDYTYYSFATNNDNLHFYDHRENKTVRPIQIDVAALNQWLTNDVGGTNMGGADQITVPYAATTITTNTTSVPIYNRYGHIVGYNTVYSYGTNSTTAYMPVLLDGVTNTVSLTLDGVTTNITFDLISNTIHIGGQYYNYLKTNSITGTSSKGINSIFVMNTNAFTGSQLPAVRMIHGSQLPSSGLTIVTPEPIYVLGDYNITTNGTDYSRDRLGDTTNTYPAGLMGDAVTILSDSWDDSDTSTLPSASSTTINAATLEGIVPSVKTGADAAYSGGVENFLRLLEAWGGDTLTYNGSIVVMFPSQYATNIWSYGSYYTAPNRQWGFDTRFNNALLLPPLTPKIKATVRGTWSAW